MGPQPRRGMLDRLDHEPSQPAGRDVHHIPRRGVAAGRIPNPEEIDGPNLRTPQLTGGGEPVANLQGPPKVPAGAARQVNEDRPRGDGLAVFKKPVHNFVERAVPAHGDDAIGAVLQGLPGEPGRRLR